MVGCVGISKALLHWSRRVSLEAYRGRQSEVKAVCSLNDLIPNENLLVHSLHHEAVFPFHYSVRPSIHP